MLSVAGASFLLPFIPLLPAQILLLNILGDIPILGWLFKKKSQSHTRTELLIFVTTRILAD